MFEGFQPTINHLPGAQRFLWRGPETHTDPIARGAPVLGRPVGETGEVYPVALWPKDLARQVDDALRRGVGGHEPYHAVRITQVPREFTQQRWR